MQKSEEEVEEVIEEDEVVLVEVDCILEPSRGKPECPSRRSLPPPLVPINPLRCNVSSVTRGPIPSSTS